MSGTFIYEDLCLKSLVFFVTTSRRILSLRAWRFGAAVDVSSCRTVTSSRLSCGGHFVSHCSSGIALVLCRALSHSFLFTLSIAGYQASGTRHQEFVKRDVQSDVTSKNYSSSWRMRNVEGVLATKHGWATVVAYMEKMH